MRQQQIPSASGRGASSNKPVKIAGKISAQKAKIVSRTTAISRYKRLSGVMEDNATMLFDSIVATMPNPRVVINMSESDLKAFLGGGSPARSMPYWPDHQVTAFEHDLGVSSPWYGAVDASGVGDRSLGAYSLSLASLPDDSLCLMGGVERLFDATKDDYTRDLEEVVCDSSGIKLAMAYALVDRMNQVDGLVSPDSVMEMVKDSSRTRCHVMLMGPPAPGDVSVIVAADEDSARKARLLLDSLGKALPVEVSPGRLPMREVTRQSAGAIPVQMELRYFAAGDRVATKPMASMAFRKGVVSDASGNRVVVEWDDAEERTSMDLVEAMASLMWEPKSEPPPPSVYSLPGMDEETCSVLVGAGVDPVDLYSLASHFAPSSPKAEGWQGGMISALASLGIKASVASGKAVRDGKFGKKSWIEGRVGGSRLVIDVEPGRLEIRAGNPWTHVSGSSLPV